LFFLSQESRQVGGPKGVFEPKFCLLERLNGGTGIESQNYILLIKKVFAFSRFCYGLLRYRKQWCFVYLYQIEQHRLNLFVLLFRSEKKKKKEDQELTRMERTMTLVSIIKGYVKIKA